MEIPPPSTPVPDPLGLCRLFGESRNGAFSIVGGASQRLAVLPDGSGEVFEVTTQFSVYPSFTPGGHLPRARRWERTPAARAGQRRSDFRRRPRACRVNVLAFIAG